MVSKTQLLLPSILPLRFATLGSRIVTKDYIILFMVPREKGVSSEIVNELKSCLYNIFDSEHFFILMETYFSTLPGEGGKISLHLKKKDSESWNILKNAEHYSTNAIPLLDAKLLDTDIEKTLERMFPGESFKDGYQRLGWKDRVSSPFIKREKY
jgi:hypothetical protein